MLQPCLALLGVRGRLADALLRLARARGMPTPHGIAIKPAVPQAELSAVVAATREAVNRQMRLWETQGVLARQDGGLVVLRRDLLLRATKS